LFVWYTSIPMSQSLLIIDGFSLAFRSFYSYPTHLTDKEGNPINAVLGFVTLMLQQINTTNPDYLCVCFDRKEPTFRHKMFSDYKAHRPPPPEEFSVQVPVLRKILEELHIPTLDFPGYEADDLMGTLSAKSVQEGVTAYLMTGDHDTFQLINDHVNVIIQKKGVPLIVSNENILDVQGVVPDQIIDYKALKGDSSDNIPGVKGIGDKTAISLLSQFTTLETIYERLDEVKSKSVRSKLEQDKERAFLSKELATIDVDVPIQCDFSTLKYEPNWNLIVDILKAYHFQSLVKKYQGRVDEEHEPRHDQPSDMIKTPDGRYLSISTVAEVKSLIPYLQGGFAIDLETTSLSIDEAEIVGIALSYKDSQGLYIPLNDYVSSSSELMLFDSPSESEFKMNPILECLKPLLEDNDIPKITHNGKYEYLVLRSYGITLRGLSFDTMLAAFLLFPGEKVGLKDLVLRHLSYEMTTYESLTGKGKHQVNFKDISIDQATEYAAADADFTFRLKNLFEPMLQEKGLYSLFQEIEVPLQIVLAEMEETGVMIDKTYLSQLEHEFQKQADVLKTAILDKAGEPFNVNSTKQLADILYDKLGLPVLKKTKTGRSTDSTVLEKLKSEYPIANDVLSYRSLEKLLSTYVKALPTMISKRTGRIHTSFNQTIAITGRLSSTGPNLQNIPIRTKEGHLIRGAFIASSDDHELFAADYSQIELRIMAHLSEDPQLVEAFVNGEDIHSSTASIIHNVPLSEVTKEQRYSAKAVNFGILYGQSAFGLSEQLSIGRGEAKEIIDNYFLKFPKIKDFIDQTIQYVKENRFVRTEFGRIRPIPDIDSRLFQRRQFAERTAVNTRVQGTAADIIKVAMNRIAFRFKQENIQSKMIIQVHDELVFDVLSSEKETVFNIVREEMETVTTLNVPLVVDSSFGANWQEC